MHAQELRQRIELFRGVPDLPACVRLLLTHAEEGCLPAWLLHLLENDQDAGPLVENLPGKRLAGLPFLQVFRRLLRQALPKLFPVGEGGGLDREAFWREAFAAADLAEALAAHAPGVNPAQAYAAGLLQNVGKLVLDQLAPEAFARAQELVQDQGAFELEAESREIGVDHAVAGKWLAEAWNLPAWLVSVIWLHHQSPALLPELDCPAKLVDAATLAEALAQQARSGLAPRLHPAVEERRRRLNIATDVLVRLQPGPPPWEEEFPAAGDTASVAPPQVSVPHLKRELRRLESLQDLAQGLVRCRGTAAALHTFTEQLRKHFAFPAGICLLQETAPQVLLGKSWRTPTGALNDLLIPTGEGKSPAVHLLRQVLRASRAAASNNSVGAGLLVLPFAAREVVIGRLILDSGETAPVANETLQQLLAFIGLGAEYLAQCLHFEGSARRAEALSGALWRQDAQHQQALKVERLAAVAKLAAGAAHEINNPLAIISGQAQILLSKAHTPEEGRALETIVHQARRAGRVMIDLMQFARPAAPKLEPAMVTFLLHQMAKQARERLERNGIRLVEDYAQGLPRVMMDKRQMEQALTHLCRNAEQAMKRGGGVLTFRVRASRDRASVIVQICDTGAGIPPEQLHQVFEPFFSMWGSSEQPGLGLPVCHAIIENHRGMLNLHSSPGEGVTCTITLPACAEMPEEKGAAAATKEARAFTVLLAERQEELREVLRETLQARNFAVRAAGDSLEAMAALMGYPIDAVLLDLHLYTPRGIPLLHQIRERYPDLPVIALASADAADEIADATQLGVHACLRKPFRLEQLFQELTHLLQHRHVA
ncbi:MAG: HDOD domain-containing protein [Candidatus Hydrogenedentes bacterium]|nr:HDOD domain-containing protein [Candidatus Hydrogenedentota bacterium]